MNKINIEDLISTPKTRQLYQNIIKEGFKINIFPYPEDDMVYVITFISKKYEEKYKLLWNSEGGNLETFLEQFLEAINIYPTLFYEINGLSL